MYSFRSIIDGGSDSDLVYYNASIISSKTSDVGAPLTPTVVRFNETRDAPIVKDASQYYFSIIRFAMNGPGKNLPLFIPLIQTNGYNYPVQPLPNLTIYYVSIGYQQLWNYTDLNGVAQQKLFTITPNSVPVVYVPETQNLAAAPEPVSPAGGIVKQDLSTRYYWVYTYKHWARLVNTALEEATKAVYLYFKSEWEATAGTPAFPFTESSWAAFVAPPFIKYDEESRLFSIYGDTRNFNICSPAGDPFYPVGGPPGTQPSIPIFTAAPFTAGDPPSPESQPYFRLFFNDNLFGLFSNFNNTYYGLNGNDSLYWPLGGAAVKLGNDIDIFTRWVYSNEILFENQLYTNIQNNNPFLQGLNAAPPPDYNPFFLIPPEKQILYWISKQDYPSTGTLWSPVASLVFTSTLLPLKKENTAKPVILNQNNTNNTNSPSAFEPIITDFVIDQQIERAEGWRDFTLYEPSAEYRMVSMTASHEEVRNIDIQVYWKYRLTGELIPLTMFNCSDVTIKMMFRKIDYRS